MTPPDEGYFHFRGIRTVRGRQRIAVNEPVHVCREWHGTQPALGVAMFGRQTHYRLESFDGEWLPLLLNLEGLP